MEKQDIVLKALHEAEAFILRHHKLFEPDQSLYMEAGNLQGLLIRARLEFGTEMSNRNQLARRLAISLKEFVLIADGLTKVSTYSQAANSPEEAEMNDPMYDYSAVRELIIQADAALDILKKMGGGDV